MTIKSGYYSYEGAIIYYDNDSNKVYDFGQYVTVDPEKIHGLKKIKVIGINEAIEDINKDPYYGAGLYGAGHLGLYDNAAVIGLRHKGG